MADIAQLLGGDADDPLQYRCMTVPSGQFYLLGRGYIDHVMIGNNRPSVVLRNIQTLYDTGCLVDTGYLSILPTDQGVEHSAKASFAASPLYSDPENIIELVVEAGYNCAASAYGILASVLRRHTHRIPFLIKLNHNEALSYPNTCDQTLCTNVEQAFNMGAVTADAIIYFGSKGSRHQIEKISTAFEHAHELSMVTVLWVYLCSSAFKKDGVDYRVSTGLTGQTNHLVTTIGADIVKQKTAENNGGCKAVNYGYTDDHVYSKLTSESPIDLMRYQLASYYMGRAGLINSGGAVSDEADLSDVVRTTVTNKHASGMGPILGHKAFKRLMADGVKLINAVRDIYLDNKTTIA